MATNVAREGTIGVIAEDATDVAALSALIRRVLGKKVAIKHRAGEGSGEIKRKGAKWIRELSTHAQKIVVVHDLDRNPMNGELNDPDALRAILELLDCPPETSKHVCIPIEEIEAWFWACGDALALVARKPMAPHPSPHLISRPKEELLKLSVGSNKKPRYSTNDNVAIAEKLNLAACAAACPSFRELLSFLEVAEDLVTPPLVLRKRRATAPPKSKKATGVPE